MSKVVEKCCGCIELRTGCLIIGYLNLISDIIYKIVIRHGIVRIRVLEEYHKVNHQDAIITIVLLYFMMLLLILDTSFTIVFLIGLHRNKPGHVKVFLIFSIIFTILEFLTRTYITLKASEPGKNSIPGIIIGTVIGLLLTIYFLLVIQSQYVEMKNPTNGPVIYSPATNNPAGDSPAIDGPAINNQSQSQTNLIQ